MKKCLIILFFSFLLISETINGQKVDLPNLTSVILDSTIHKSILNKKNKDDNIQKKEKDTIKQRLKKGKKGCIIGASTGVIVAAIFSIRASLLGADDAEIGFILIGSTFGCIGGVIGFFVGFF